MTNTENPRTLTQINRELKALTYELREAVVQAKMEGASWANIGATIGMTKQAAQQKYGLDVKVEESGRQWALENPEAHAAAVARGVEDAKKTLAEIEARVAAQMKAADNKTPETPSIFLEPKAPAKPGASVNASGVTVFKPKERQHAAILPRGSKPIRTSAEPGTGKGPHLCTGCGSNNHHGPRRGTIEFNDGCQPTKYDTQAETNYLNARNSK